MKIIRRTIEQSAKEYVSLHPGLSVGAVDDKRFFTGKFPVPQTVFQAIGRKK